MKHEFNNRIDAQRDILSIVNSKNWKEDLLGLSSGAIKRWTDINGLTSNDIIVELIIASSEKLFFLANKSQEQITEGYRAISKEVFVITEKIREEINSIKHAAR